MSIAAAFFYLLNSVLGGRHHPAVLVYHKIAPDGIKGAGVGASLFGRQMAMIKRLGLEVAPLQDLIGGGSLRRRVFLTFDDGTDDFKERAWPIIKSFGYPVTLFIIAGNIGKSGCLSREALKELVSSGLVTIGSHTLRHRYLPDLAPFDAELEIKESKRILEEALGAGVDFIAYPWGGFNEKIEDTVKSCGYKAAFSTNQGFRSGFDPAGPYDIKRMTVAEREPSLRFIAKLSGFGAYFYRRMRPQERKAS